MQTSQSDWPHFAQYEIGCELAQGTYTSVYEARPTATSDNALSRKWHKGEDASPIRGTRRNVDTAQNHNHNVVR
jgi:hypothetical protein